jgi:hypothetical protein
MDLTNEQRRALRKVMKAKLALWDASLEAEELLGRDVDAAGESLDDYCAHLQTADDVDNVQDEDLLSAFDLG